MKTKRRNYWSFFWRVGAGFLAFWLVVMIAFSLLMGWQKAQSMLYNIEEHESYFMNDYIDSRLESYVDTDENGVPYTDEALRKNLKSGAFTWEIHGIPAEETPAVRITEAAVVDGDGNVMLSNRYWIEANTSGEWYDDRVFVDMTGQPAEMYELILQAVEFQEGVYPPETTIMAWVDGDLAYPKQIIVQPRRSTGTAWVADGEPTVMQCTYDETNMRGLPLMELHFIKLVIPGPNDFPLDQLAESLASERRIALRELVESGRDGGDDRSICTPWLVQFYTRHIRYCPYTVGEHWVTVCYAAEAYPLKACLPVLLPVWGFSFVLAVLFSAILAYALLCVWRKQARIEQVRRDTTAALAHELKTPLSVLSATAELLAGDMAQDKRAHYLDVIRQQAARMDGSVRGMLELSRLEAGAKALRREPFSLSDLAQERLDAAVPPDADLHTEVTTDGADTLEADPDLLARALDALLENAVQHTASGGSIAVRIEKGVCAIINTGAAIPPDALPRLWEAYYQADASRAEKGSGLGLSIAGTVFGLHGYAYGAENTDEGPRFWFRFG